MALSLIETRKISKRISLNVIEIKKAGLSLIETRHISKAIASDVLLLKDEKSSGIEPEGIESTVKTGVASIEAEQTNPTPIIDIGSELSLLMTETDYNKFNAKLTEIKAKIDGNEFDEQLHIVADKLSELLSIETENILLTEQDSLINKYDINKISNKPANLVTQDEYLFAVSEMKKINPSLVVTDINNNDGFITGVVKASVEGGVINERMKVGKLISRITSGETMEVSINKRKEKANEIKEKEKKQRLINEKSRITRDANSPENNITKNNGTPISYADTLKESEAWLNSILLSDYERSFIKDIKGKKSLSSKQFNFLSSIGAKFGYLIPKKSVRTAPKNEAPTVSMAEADIPTQRDDGSWYDAETGFNIR